MPQNTRYPTHKQHSGTLDPHHHRKITLLHCQPSICHKMHNIPQNTRYPVCSVAADIRGITGIARLYHNIPHNLNLVTQQCEGVKAQRPSPAVNPTGLTAGRTCRPNGLHTQQQPTKHRRRGLHIITRVAHKITQIARAGQRPAQHHTKPTISHT